MFSTLVVYIYHLLHFTNRPTYITLHYNCRALGPVSNGIGNCLQLDKHLGQQGQLSLAIPLSIGAMSWE